MLCLRITHCPQPSVHSQLSTAHSQLSTAHSQLSTPRCLLPAAQCPLFTPHSQSPNCPQPTPNFPIPDVYCLLPSAYCPVSTPYCPIETCVEVWLPPEYVFFDKIMKNLIKQQNSMRCFTFRLFKPQRKNSRLGFPHLVKKRRKNTINFPSL